MTGGTSDATFMLAILACILGSIAIGLLIGTWRPRRARKAPMGSGGYPSLPSPVSAPQHVREHVTAAYRSCDAPTRRMSVTDALDPLPFCERCGQRMRRTP